MPQPKTNLEGPRVRRDELLERYYDRLQEWALTLTRGDSGKAQDLVHDLCLHLSLSTPDLQVIQNLDGYLYTCLKHIFLSNIAQSRRDALRLVGSDEFDSATMALRQRDHEHPLQRQNDLRNICLYAIWRNAQAKSASYFILRFFHGYTRREIASIAKVSLSTIDPKLSQMRSELHVYLREPRKLVILNHQTPPCHIDNRTITSSVELIREMQTSILSSRKGVCLAEDALLALYAEPASDALPALVLSHIVCCARCLAIVDNFYGRPTLEDREPLDGMESEAKPQRSTLREKTPMSRNEFFRRLRRERDEILEHRPRTLSISVDGRFLASSDVHGTSSVLSARVDEPTSVNFVEVFSEQGLRLALLSFSELTPPERNDLIQIVHLADDRWLRLALTLDGLGLDCEVTYHDPSQILEQAQEAPPVSIGNLDSPGLLRRVLLALRPSNYDPSRFLAPPAAIGLFALLAFFVFSFFYLSRDKRSSVPPDGSALLDRAIKREEAQLKDKTESQTFNIQIVSDGILVAHGTIDVLRDADDSRVLRRLYDEQHHLVATEWKTTKDGGEDVANKAWLRQFDSQETWKTNVSAAAFRASSGGADTRTYAHGDRVEIATVAAVVQRPKLSIAGLTLNSDLHPVEEVLRTSTTTGYTEAHFVEASYSVRPRNSFRERDFDPRQPPLSSSAKGHDPNLLALRIAVFYELNRLGADTSEPILVHADRDAIYVDGIVPTAERRQLLTNALKLLPDSGSLKVNLQIPGAPPSASRTVAPTEITTFDMQDASPMASSYLRKQFLIQGVGEKEVDAVSNRFSEEAISHAQRALQHASALSRVAHSFTPDELSHFDTLSSTRWTSVVSAHVSALNLELQALHTQVSGLTHEAAGPTSVEVDPIRSPQSFTRICDQLLATVQQLNRDVGSEFASGQNGGEIADPVLVLSHISQATQPPEIVAIKKFAEFLAASVTVPKADRRASVSQGSLHRRS